MTGIERLIQKTSNATSAAILGRGGVVVAVEPWRLEVARQEAIEDEEKRLRDKWRMRRRMVRYGCE